MTLTPRSGDRGTVVRSHMVMKYGHVMSWLILLCVCLQFYLDLLLYVVKDEPLGVDEVIWGIEGDGVQRSAVSATSIHSSASRF